MQTVKSFSPTICVENPAANRDFYVKYFDAKVIFDCDFYINVSIGEYGLCFMKPMNENQKLFNGDGLTYNIEVEDVDKEYDRLKDEGLVILQHLQDNPWGDRSFIILAPENVVLYIHQTIEPTEEFRAYYK